jgi:nitrogen fixation NifU-like protein
VNDDLYQQAILDLAKAGAVAERLPAPDRTAARDNPLCGDRTTIDVRLEAGRIAALGHRTRGCALCQASAALLARTAPGATPADVRAAAAAIAASVAERGRDPAPPWQEFAVFAPVRRHPSRRDCVLLPLGALLDALA